MYARQRGVLLLPEMDAPSHAAYGWQFGPEADLGKDLLRNGRKTSLNVLGFFLKLQLRGELGANFLMKVIWHLFWICEPK